MWSPKSQNSPAIGAFARFSILLLALAPLFAQNRGQAEIALQGFYMGGNTQPLFDTSGVAVRFQDFAPGLGFLSGSLEAYGAQNRFQTGENFLELRGVAWMGRHWAVTGGDFHTPSTLVEFPFYNVFNPEIMARGVRVQSSHDGDEYAFFAGQETLMAGPRIPYRILAPQTLIGASAIRTIAPNFRLAARLMQFSSNQQAMADNASLFPMGRDLGTLRTAALQASYTPWKQLKIYGEVSHAFGGNARDIPSAFGGISYVSSLLTFRANYASQSVSYLPLAGYYAGDRRGPFAEIHFHPLKRLDLYGSASHYVNNLEKNPAVASLTSATTAGGITATLPAKFSVSGEISEVRIGSSGGDQDPSTSDNRQVSATVSRPIRNQTVRVTWREINLEGAPPAQRQTSTEVEDLVQVHHIFFGAAARFQQASGAERRNTMFYRGSVQGNIGRRLSLYGNLEIGDDLANRTIFSTSAYSTTVFGAGWQISRRWNLQAEAFRNKLNLDLNPESIFVLEGGGMPISDNLASLMQWSLLIRLTHQMTWNGGMPAEQVERLAETAVPLVGAVEGIVRIHGVSGESLAPAVPVTMDGNRLAVTGPDGHYRFDDVPEGLHVFALDPASLPAEFDPGPVNTASIRIQPRKTVRTDFNVLPLLTLEGNVVGSPGAPLDGILIRLLPGDRYTMTDAEGHFAFYNVREGDFQIALDSKSLPAGGELRSDAAIPLQVRVGAPAPAFQFRFEVLSTQKTIRKVLDKK